MSTPHPVSAIIDMFEMTREELVAKLRDAAYAKWESCGRPVSVNDVRHILAEHGYAGDPRILAATFPLKEWQPYGYTTTNSLLAHARSVRTFVPRTAGSRHV